KREYKASYNSSGSGLAWAQVQADAAGTTLAARLRERGEMSGWGVSPCFFLRWRGCAVDGCWTADGAWIEFRAVTSRPRSEPVCGRVAAVVDRFRGRSCLGAEAPPVCDRACHRGHAGRSPH